jgi:hypothetical protein
VCHFWFTLFCILKFVKRFHNEIAGVTVKKVVKTAGMIIGAVILIFIGAGIGSSATKATVRQK